jgi:cytochrome c5
MSQHHSDTVKEDIETHAVKLVIAISIGAVGLVVGIIMLAYFAVGSYRVGEADGKASTPEAVAQRIAPATTLLIEPPKGPAPAASPAVAPKAATGPTAAAVIPAALPAATAAAPGGEGVYKAACMVCHATGVAGAPKTGDKGGWGARLVKGKPLLYDHALKGFNAMPAKGGNAALTDHEVKAAVDYLVAQVK